jgi:hypothetical protein
MLIATSLAAIAVASSLAAGPEASVNLAQSPIVINISAAPNVSASVVELILAEADAIFRSAGVSFIWRRGEQTPTTLRVAIGNERGAPRDRGMPLGWIMFEDDRPDQKIYVSYANAERFMEDSPEVIGRLNNMPRVEREKMLGRVIGRALAHELGHYLLASKSHTPKGLLKAVRSAQELFAADRKRFQLEPAQRTQIAARLQREALLASHEAPASGRRSPLIER